MEERETALEDLRYDIANIKSQLEDILKGLKLSEYEKTIRGEIEDIECILFDIDQELADLEDEAAHQNFIDRQEDLRHMENEWR